MADCVLELGTYKIDQVVEVGAHQRHQELGLKRNGESLSFGILGEELHRVFSVERASLAVTQHVKGDSDLEPLFFGQAHVFG